MRLEHVSISSLSFLFHLAFSNCMLLRILSQQRLCTRYIIETVGGTYGQYSEAGLPPPPGGSGCFRIGHAAFFNINNSHKIW